MTRPRCLVRLLLLSVCTLGPCGVLHAQKKIDYLADVKFAVEAIGKQCKTLLVSKKIDWPKVTAPLLAEAKKVRTDEEHVRLLWRLLARLQDGHAEVRLLERGKDVKVEWPDRSGGPGLFLCRAQQKIWVKNVFGPAAAAGIEPGQEIVSLDGQPASKWLEARQAELSDLSSFSTPQQAFFFTTHWGLAGARDGRLAIETKGKAGGKKVTLSFGKINQTAWGPAFPPDGLQQTQDLNFGRTAKGFGYVHVRRSKDTVVAQMDEALGKLGAVPGLILDFRGNSGGAFDHDALFGRFFAKGQQWQFGEPARSAGENPYGGPIVVIVDATVRSAGETAAGMFKEAGRAFCIGESPTAGMSSSKVKIELPSQLCELFVSTHSNKARYQNGKGIEGVGVVPDELVEFDPADLAAKKDTLIARAEALLADFPQAKVRYVPSEQGWTPPAK